MLQDLLKEKKMSMYQLAKCSNIPYTTINDIVNNRTRLEKCSVETVYRIAKSLDVTIDELIEPYLIKRPSFDNFKSTVCHRLKRLGDLDFIVEVLESREIIIYYHRKWYPECLYLLALLDYVSRENEVPLCKDYDEFRKYKLEQPLYPSGIMAISAATKDKSILEKAYESSIPEFRRFNIIENEVRNVA